MMNTERQQSIVRLIRERGSATVAELSELFDVSMATVRRDLASLADRGAILRAHGGAVAAERALPEPPMIQRMAEHQQEKNAIGRSAAQLVEDGETVFIGSGTTTLEVARNLSEKKGLTVITNALNVANLLANHPDATLVITGGLVRPTELSMIGHLTEKALGELHADRVIMGIRAIHVEHGLTNDYLPETETDRAIIRAAPQLIMVADHSKIGKVSTVSVAPITAMHTLVTDSAAPKGFVAKLRGLGIQVILA